MGKIRKIVAVDLFCGVGGLTHGLKLSGINVSAGIDIDPTCKYPYEKNNRTAVFVEEDVAQLSNKTVLKYFGDADVKVLVGCAPCQPFSLYTLRYRKKGRTDEKWKLLNAFSDKICAVLPDIVSMENVPELAKENIFLEYKTVLEKHKYTVSWGIVFCPDYGIPQNRRRLVLLASRHGRITIIPPMYNTSNYRTVRDAIGSLPSINAGEVYEDDPLHSSSLLNKKNLERIRESLQGGTWRDWNEKLQLACHKKNSGKTYPSVYGRMCWDKPSPTITTQFYGYGNGRFGHPEQDRALSLREGAILQSFPRNYEFTDPENPLNRRKIGTHIGNAVPVLLGKAIGESIKVHLAEVTKNGKN